MNGCLCKTCVSETCWNAGHDTYIEKCSMYSRKPITNADHLRSMSDEELAEFLWSIGQNPGGWNYINGKPIFHSGKGNGWLDWLRQEAE